MEQLISWFPAGTELVEEFLFFAVLATGMFAARVTAGALRNKSPDEIPLLHADTTLSALLIIAAIFIAGPTLVLSQTVFVALIGIGYAGTIGYTIYHRWPRVVFRFKQLTDHREHARLEQRGVYYGQKLIGHLDRELPDDTFSKDLARDIRTISETEIPNALEDVRKLDTHLVEVDQIIRDQTWKLRKKAAERNRKRDAPHPLLECETDKTDDKKTPTSSTSKQSHDGPVTELQEIMANRALLQRQREKKRVYVDECLQFIRKLPSDLYASEHAQSNTTLTHEQKDEIREKIRNVGRLKRETEQESRRDTERLLEHDSTLEEPSFELENETES